MQTLTVAVASTARAWSDHMLYLMTRESRHSAAPGLQYVHIAIRIDNFYRNSKVLSPGASYWSKLNAWKSHDKVGTRDFNLMHSQKMTSSTSKTRSFAWLVLWRLPVAKWNMTENAACGFPLKGHDCPRHNFGFWVLGSPAVGVVGLRLY
jgi:hypothetical protein